MVFQAGDGVHGTVWLSCGRGSHAVSLRAGPAALLAHGDEAEWARLLGASHGAEAGLRAAWSPGPCGEQRCGSSRACVDRDVLSAGRGGREAWEAGPGPGSLQSIYLIKLCIQLACLSFLLGPREGRRRERGQGEKERTSGGRMRACTLQRRPWPSLPPGTPVPPSLAL